MKFDSFEKLPYMLYLRTKAVINLGTNLPQYPVLKLHLAKSWRPKNIWIPHTTYQK
jgi:hypothetical protein